MTVLVGNHDFLTGCKLNGDSVLNAEFCLEYVEISTNGVNNFKFLHVFNPPLPLFYYKLLPNFCHPLIVEISTYPLK